MILTGKKSKTQKTEFRHLKNRRKKHQNLLIKNRLNDPLRKKKIKNGGNCHLDGPKIFEQIFFRLNFELFAGESHELNSL